MDFFFAFTFQTERPVFYTSISFQIIDGMEQLDIVKVASTTFVVYFYSEAFILA